MPTIRPAIMPVSVSSWHSCWQRSKGPRHSDDGEIMTKPVEIYDYKSKDFAKTVTVCGREFVVLETREHYKSVNSYSTYFGERYMRYPDISVTLTLRQIPPPPPPTPKRTWTSAMGLRRPKR